MKKTIVAALALAACSVEQPSERYGFVAVLGRDTVSVESVTRRGNRIISDEVDRFPRLRQRHTEIELGDDGSIRHLVMDIHTPSEPANERDRRVEARVSRDSVHLTKRDGTGTKVYNLATGGTMAMPHLPQMYSLYELYLGAASRQARATKAAVGERVRMRQFYIDREFDRFPLHQGFVWTTADGKTEIRHDWLSGTGEAVLDSSGRLQSYSGDRTTYKVDVKRVDATPDVKAIGARFAEAESRMGSVTQLSVRDTTVAKIGGAELSVEYSRPLARGRTLLGDVIPYGQVWRTGANAATHFSTSVPITIGALNVPAGTYTLWTVPRPAGADLIVNRETGQWGTGYNPAMNLGRVALTVDTVGTPVEAFTIAIDSAGARSGTLRMEWGTFRWAAPFAIR